MKYSILAALAICLALFLPAAGHAQVVAQQQISLGAGNAVAPPVGVTQFVPAFSGFAANGYASGGCGGVGANVFVPSSFGFVPSGFGGFVSAPFVNVGFGRSAFIGHSAFIGGRGFGRRVEVDSGPRVIRQRQVIRR
jgi:hypothetical protein